MFLDFTVQTTETRRPGNTLVTVINLKLKQCNKVFQLVLATLKKEYGYENELKLLLKSIGYKKICQHIRIISFH